jgi:hypothetical protein
MTMNLINKIVYLAAPYSIGDKEANVKRSITAANYLMDMGAYVFNPLLSHYTDQAQERPPDYWYAFDLVFLERCDVLIFLDGESKGVRAEIEQAEILGMPVIFYNDFLQ